MAEPTQAETASHCGFVAVIGAPNVGKSTLVNRIVGAKVSIVTPKAQTTRTRITAIAISGQSQIIFVDTPGIFQAQRRFDRAMVAAAWSSAENADSILVLVDATRSRDAAADSVVRGLKSTGRKAILALNKIDRVPRPALLALAAGLNAENVFSEIFMISALNGDGVPDLEAALARALPPGPWHYPEDQLADISERLLAAEITREKLFLELHQELPYALTVETESWQERKDGGVRVEQIIFVARDNHKAMVLGKGGRMVKRVGQLAREEMTRTFGRTVHLFLFVKVRRHWDEDPERYREMGLEYLR